MKQYDYDQHLREMFGRETTIPETMQTRLEQSYDALRRKAAGKTNAGSGRCWMKTAALAAAVVAALSVSAAAVAGGNLFHEFTIFGNQYGALGDHASAAVPAEALVEDEHIFATGRIDSVYYDGQSLALAYAISGDMEYTEAWEPTAEELAQMEKLDAYSPPAYAYGETEQNDLMRQRGEPYGYVYYSTYASDHTKTADGVDIMPETGVSYYNDAGEFCELREFMSPFPEEMQDLEEIELVILLRHTARYFWFDGESCYQRTEILAEVPMTTTAVRTESRAVYGTGSGEIDGVAYTVEVENGLLGGLVTITAEEAIFTPRWHLVMYDEAGNEYLPVSVETREEDTDAVTFRYKSRDNRPKSLQVIPFCWPEEAEYFANVEINEAHGVTVVFPENEG